jgi:RNA polymerase sigma factor (sigma-70 family)
VSGDPHAISDTIRLIREIVSHRGYYIDEQDRAEIVQESLAQLWSATSRRDSELPRDFSAFVRTVTHRRCVDWIRRRRVTEPVSDAIPIDGESPEAAVLANEQARVGVWVLKQLAAPCRDLLRLHAIEDLPVRLIAQSHGKQERAIRSQLYRCLQAARELIDRQRRGESRLDPRQADL